MRRETVRRSTIEDEQGYSEIVTYHLYCTKCKAEVKVDYARWVDYGKETTP